MVLPCRAAGREVAGSRFGLNLRKPSWLLELLENRRGAVQCPLSRFAEGQGRRLSAPGWAQRELGEGTPRVPAALGLQSILVPPLQGRAFLAAGACQFSPGHMLPRDSWVPACRVHVGGLQPVPRGSIRSPESQQRGRS